MRWNRDELLILLSLYHKLRFGQISSRLPAIIDLAEKLGRTPSSISMKLGNLASFDPVLQLRGIRGLQGASQLDRETWDEYHANAAELIPLAQEKFDALFVESEAETTEVVPGTGIRRITASQSDGTDSLGLAKQRRGQSYFRDIVLNNYENRCALTGLPVRELLVASHILPWHSHPAERLNVRNGISLNRLHDAAFDQGLIGFDDDLKMFLSPRITSFLPHPTVVSQFQAHEGGVLEFPADATPPDAGFLARHRERFS